MRAFAGNVGWHEAEHSCNGQGAHLVSMHNEAYNSRLRSFATTKVGDNQIWTGLNKNAAGGFQWTDGSAVTYTNWRGNPSENVDDECMELWRDNYWQLAKCKETRPYVCKRRRPQEYCWGQTGSFKNHLTLLKHFRTGQRAMRLCRNHGKLVRFRLPVLLRSGRGNQLLQRF